MALDFAATYKVLVLGDSNVGKTCIVHRYCDERYYDTYISTIGIDFKQKIINLDGTPIKLQIWDTAGQERFRTLTTAYYRGAMGILLMYDVTSLESFNHLSYWLRNIQENASPDVVKVLAANKCDATAHRAVDAERGQKIAENFDMPFFEVSCKENINIEEAFLTLARRIREQRGRRASLFEASEREGADSVIKAQSPSQQGDAWRMEAIVEYNYVAQEDDELTLRKGDIITEIKMMLGGWWEGTLRDKRGMFPDNFVKVLEPSSTSGGSSNNETIISVKSDEVTLRNGSSRRLCKVLFSYEPCNEDELTLVPQDSIEFLGEVEEGWWRGRLRGKVGVFPSNFVSPPVPEEQDKHKDRDKKEMCRVLFPYEAANEDELTFIEGEIITLLSKDAPDKGWWKGELNGHVGLFPDNFVEVIGGKNEHQESDQWHDSTSVSTKLSIRHSHQVKKSEKAHVRKSLDSRNVHPSNISDHFPVIDSTKKALSTSSSSISTSSTVAGTGTAGGDKKAVSGHSIISSLKRLVSDVGNNNGIGNTSAALGEELDGVERGEGAPLSHLTASRAKAPRRRPPSSQHLRHHAAGSGSVNAVLTLPAVPSTTLEDDLSNGRADTMLEQIADEETDGLAAKAKRKAPWVEELKMNQMERRKTAVERTDKVEVKKERNFSRLMTQTNVVDPVNKADADNDDSKQKEAKSPRADPSPHTDNSPATPSGQPAYVPYALYSKLLERVAALEEKQAVLQLTVGQLSEQLVPLLANASINSKV
ncbi:uncharacterized protein LOC116843802 [Odontomachus brunneus]|uniref:uncharacterized protein LOC116843802 n=1 Tax=Odontomachus brunneus TaxID=486640 RepID=UPI0013F295BE|nr:uncharacterized protein LOC116843802 [Odontomachus brunneus]